jgi:hypothetical protein
VNEPSSNVDLANTKIDDPLQTRFARVWQQIQRHNASLFLRHAMRLDMTLEQVMAAMQFENCAELAKDVRLGDLLQPQLQASQTEPRPAAAPAAPTKASKERRRRRGPEEMTQLREAVLERMRAAMGSVTTTHLCDVLKNGGFDVDLLQMNRTLNGLEEEGYLVSLGGKPKSWRLKPQGRMAPEPMVVRRGGQPPAGK